MSYTSTLPTLSGVIASTDQIDWSNPVAVTDTANLNFGKHHVITVTAADKTMTLPAVSGNGGKMISIEIASTTTKLITIDGNASETIDGATTRVMWASETCLLLCNGTSWTKIAGKSIPMIAQIYGTGNQILATQTTTKITLSNAAAGYNSFMNDTANSSIVVKRAGKYFYNGLILWNTTNAENLLVSCVSSKNNSQIDWGNGYRAASMNTSSQVNSVYDASINDTFEMYGWVNGTFTTSTIHPSQHPVLTITEIPQW